MKTVLKHAAAHKKKTAAILSVASLAVTLQLVGVLGPLVCSMPFIHDKDQCNGVATKSKEAAQELSNIKLEDGSDMPIVVEEYDGGAQ